MDADQSNVAELEQALAALPLPADEVDVLVRHLTDRMIGHFGAETFDVWQAKWGLSRHSAEELAMLTVAKMAPLLATVPPGTVASLAAHGKLAAPVTFPWENRY